MVILLEGLPRTLHALYPKTAFPNRVLSAGRERRIAALTAGAPRNGAAEKLTPSPHDIFFNMNTLEDYYRAKAILEAPLRKANPE